MRVDVWFVVALFGVVACAEQGSTEIVGNEPVAAADTRLPEAVPAWPRHASVEVTSVGHTHVGLRWPDARHEDALEYQVHANGQLVRTALAAQAQLTGRAVGETLQLEIVAVAPRGTSGPPLRIVVNLQTGCAGTVETEN